MKIFIVKTNNKLDIKRTAWFHLKPRLIALANRIDWFFEHQGMHGYPYELESTL
ncbi:hypothetical protein [Rhodococcus qingshengii]|uniref:hypothetical protein n=1 Tax=Rhodococcus qingshengii TaxID=334542 RepID=UPI00294297D4|nr:hypothetical protein [Rhodococcus qingshengii]WOI85979.1 hypothetical protein R0122_22635 [Rhodococcus qingshengii]